MSEIQEELLTPVKPDLRSGSNADNGNQDEADERINKGVDMNQETMMKFKKLFEEQKSGLIYSYQILNDEFILKSDELSDESDFTSAVLEQGMKMRLRNREALFLKKIDEALLKIQSGNFGICECCEEDIELSRLEARPTAALCISCKESEEMNETRSADGRKSKSLGAKSFLCIA